MILFVCLYVCLFWSKEVRKQGNKHCGIHAWIACELGKITTSFQFRVGKLVRLCEEQRLRLLVWSQAMRD